METRLRTRRLSAVVLGTALLGLGTTIAGCNQGPGDYRQKPMQKCLAAAETKSEKNDCYFENAQANGN
jgi:hypothetical protein